jgi:hypothetical protein
MLLEAWEVMLLDYKSRALRRSGRILFLDLIRKLQI